MASRIKELAKKSTALIIAAKIYGNWRDKRRFQTGDSESLHGSTHSILINSISASVDYINAQFNDYVRYSGLSIDTLRGIRVLELGFGDNLGVALKFIVAGVSKTVCLDKYYSKQDVAHQRKIYLALRATLSRAQQQNFDDAIDLSRGLDVNDQRISCIYGGDVEDSQDLFATEKFDLIVSRAVIQEIYEPEGAFRAMDRLLFDGGYMLHKIDLSDLGMFRDNAKHPLTFLTIPERIYRLMAINSGNPNRKLLNYYKTVMNEMNYDTKMLITDIIGIGEVGKGSIHPHKEEIVLNDDFTEASLDLIREIRPRLISKFKRLSDLELMVAGIFIIARKKAEVAEQ